MERARVTVIIPTFNRATLLPETLESLIAQLLSSWECLVVDDGSTDNTQAIVSEYTQKDARIKYIKRPADRLKGANTCRNIGFELASGEFVKWMDSDDLLDPDCLQKQVNTLTNDGSDVCFSQTNYFLSSGGQVTFIPEKVWGKLTPHAGQDMLTSYLFYGMRWQPGAVLWRKSFLETKPFLEGLQNSQEWLMHYKYILREPKVSFVDENLCHARVHTGSMSNAKNKKGNYYYHQCLARIEALRLLDQHGKLRHSFVVKMVRFILWNHLFILYKGAPLKAFSFLRFYPKLVTYFLQKNS